MEKVIIFDLDGTLYQTHLTLIKAIEKTFKDLNLEIPKNDTITENIGNIIEDLCFKLVNYKNEEMVSKVRAYEKELIKEGKLFEGVKDVLVELISLGYKLVICSNSSYEYIQTILKSTNIINLFLIIKGREKDKSKTLLIKEILEETKAEYALVVGDRFVDIKASEENHLISIGALYGYGKNEVSEATYTIKSIKQLIDLIYKIEVYHTIEKIINERKTNNCFIVGINGVDTSGKTMFSRELSEYLIKKGFKIQLIHIDDFHNQSAIRNKGSNPIDSYIDNAFNIDYLESNLLEDIKEGKLVKKPLKLLNLETDRYDIIKEYDICQNTIVIVEGVLLYREPLIKYFDLKIFIDITFEEVYKRAELRDVPKYGVKFLDKYKNKYIPIQKKYLKEYKPLKKSHLIINNINFNKPKIKKCLY